MPPVITGLYVVILIPVFLAFLALEDQNLAAIRLADCDLF